MSLTEFYTEPSIVMLGPFRHPERTWPNLSIYVPAITRLDPFRRQYPRFKRSLIDPRWTRLDNQSALGQICQSMSPLCPVQTLLDAYTYDSRDPWYRNTILSNIFIISDVNHSLFTKFKMVDPISRTETAKYNLICWIWESRILLDYQF